jgi:hypothetical protein
LSHVSALEFHLLLSFPHWLLYLLSFFFFFSFLNYIIYIFLTQGFTLARQLLLLFELLCQPLHWLLFKRFLGYLPPACPFLPAWGPYLQLPPRYSLNSSSVHMSNLVVFPPPISWSCILIFTLSDF